jgi:hypothetical protein
MPALYALPLLVAVLGQSEPASTLPAPPTPPPLVSPSPSPGPTPSPTPTTPPTPVPAASTSPSPTPSPSPSGTPLFGYVVDPPASTGQPRIVEIAINDRIIHRGGMLMVKITTSPDVKAMIARTWGREIGIPVMGPGVFAGQQQLPTGIPFMLLDRTYDIEFVGTTADGRTVSFTLPLRLER